MGANLNASTLIGFLQQFGRRQRTLGSQRIVVFLTETLHLFQSTDDERYGCQLCFRVGNLVFVQGKRLRYELVRHRLLGLERNAVQDQSSLQK